MCTDSRDSGKTSEVRTRYEVDGRHTPAFFVVEIWETVFEVVCTCCVRKEGEYFGETVDFELWGWMPSKLKESDKIDEIVIQKHRHQGKDSSPAPWWPETPDFGPWFDKGRELIGEQDPQDLIPTGPTEIPEKGMQRKQGEIQEGIIDDAENKTEDWLEGDFK